jgi:SepF-like predicted cell division protein (DUF552 family)
MSDLFSNVKARFVSMVGGDEPEALNEGGEKEYVELDTSSSEKAGKVIVRPFVMEKFEDIKEIVDSLRDGNTISIINIRPLKEKDIIELKRAISKLKKTADAISGDLAGFDDDYVIATPSFAKIFRSRMEATKNQEDGVVQQATQSDSGMSSFTRSRASEENSGIGSSVDERPRQSSSTQTSSTQERSAPSSERERMKEETF